MLYVNKLEQLLNTPINNNIEQLVVQWIFKNLYHIISGK